MNAIDKSKEVLGSVSEFTDEKTTQLGETLTTVHDTAESVVAPALQSTNERVGDAALYLQESSPSQMIDDLVAIGRRNPGAAAGVIFGLGFILARKLYS